MSYSLWHHRPYSPWSSPGQNTGVGSLPFLQGIFPTQGSNPGLPHCRWILYHLSYQRSPINGKWKKLKVKFAQSCLTLCDHMRNFSGQNTGMGSLSLLQGIFPTQGSNPGPPNCKWILYQLSYKGSPRILGWVAYPFPRESSQPRNQTRVSCIEGRFFTNWAIREAHTWEGQGAILIFIRGNLSYTETQSYQ